MQHFDAMRLISLLPSLFLLSSCALFDFIAEESAYYASVKKASMVPLLPEELYPDTPEKAINHLPEASQAPLYAGRVMSEAERSSLLSAMQHATHVCIERKRAVDPSDPWQKKITTTRTAPIPMTPEARALATHWATAPQWLYMQLTPQIDIYGSFDERDHYIFLDANGNELARLSEGMPYCHPICKPAGQSHYAHMANELSAALGIDGKSYRQNVSQ